MNPLRKLSSALSTAHALVVELPGALKYVVEFARENGATTAEIAFWKAARNRWMDWACHVEGGQATPGVELSHDGDSDMMARITAVIRENSELRKQLELSEQNRIGQLNIAKERHNRVKALNFELNTLQSRLMETERALRVVSNDREGIARDRDALTDQINAARDQLGTLSSWLGFGLGGENESLVSMVGRVKEGIENHVVVQNNMAIAIAKERDDLRAKLDELERWRQVTSGKGELPAIGQKIIIRAHETAAVFVVTATDSNGPDSTFQWRPFSSVDSQEETRNNGQAL